MKTDRLPPRERGLEPECFIEVWKGSLFPLNTYYGTSIGEDSTTQNPAIDTMYYPDEQTIAVFKIYPKHK